MKELIQINTVEEGQQVVSARTLYDFLGFDGSQWSRWSKKNIVSNPYAKEGEDWQVLDNESSLRRKGSVHDYALSLDFAKRLSMLARTEKGEEVRQYFLECETMAIQKNQQSGVLDRLASLERMVSQLMDREQFRLELDQPTVYPLAVETTRAKVAQLVTRYAEATHEATYSIWNIVWNRLHILYGFNVRAQRKTAYDNLLDVAERSGQMERIYRIVTQEFIFREE